MPTIGTVIHGTLRPQDLIPAFSDELCRVDPKTYSAILQELDEDYYCAELSPVGIACYAKGYAKGVDLCDDDEWWNTERAADYLSDLLFALNDRAPVGCYFGAHWGDGADFGYWPSEED